MTAASYDRQVLVDVLVYHYRKDMASCGCGWAELGRSHPEHVATVYEESVAARMPSRAECLVAADAVEGAIHVVDDDDSAQALARLADQWRADAQDLTAPGPDQAAGAASNTPAGGSHP